VCGQILGGVLVSADLLGAAWRPIFLINLPVGAAVITAGIRFLPPDTEQGETRRLDLLGALALSATVLPALLALSLGRSEGWPIWSWACLAASVPALASFVLAERRVEARGGAPLINLRALARRAVSLGLGAQAASVGTYYALLFTLALYVQRGLGRGALVSGLTLLCSSRRSGSPHASSGASEPASDRSWRQAAPCSWPSPTRASARACSRGSGPTRCSSYSSGPEDSAWGSSTAL
jgi:hypothetical protein